VKSVGAEVRFLIGIAALIAFLVGSAAGAWIVGAGQTSPSVFGPCPSGLVVEQATRTDPRAAAPLGQHVANLTP
jgi:hypothetical protein